MAQTPAFLNNEGEHIDYTPSAAVTAGDVVVIGTDLVCIAPVSIAANAKGALATCGVWTIPKDGSNVTAGQPIYWAAAGTPYGLSTVGAGTDGAADGPLIGFALAAAGATTASVKIKLRNVDSTTIPSSFAALPAATAAAAGTVIANATQITYGYTLVTVANDTNAIKLPEAVAGAICIVKNSVANKILKVFPSVNDTINLAAANAVYNQTNGALRTYTALNAVNWTTDEETAT